MKVADVTEDTTALLTILEDFPDDIDVSGLFHASREVSDRIAGHFA